MSSNPILAALDQSSHTNSTTNQNPMAAQMHQAIDIASGGDPKSTLQNLLSQNPQMNQISSLLQACNGNYEQAVRALAQQRGIDVNQLISTYQQARSH